MSDEKPRYYKASRFDENGYAIDLEWWDAKAWRWRSVTAYPLPPAVYELKWCYLGPVDPPIVVSSEPNDQKRW